MKTIFTRSFALLLFSTFIFAGCSKTTKSKTELLTDKPWFLAYYGYDDNFNGNIDPAEDYMSACEEDNVFTFRTDGTLTEDEGANSCYSAIAYRYNWYLSSDESSITIDGSTYTIKTLDNYNLEVYSSYRTNTGLEVYIRKWTRQ
jgi:hypothetical protein